MIISGPAWSQLFLVLVAVEIIFSCQKSKLTKMVDGVITFSILGHKKQQITATNNSALYTTYFPN
jgi:hypothetical protein